ncbi:MAG: M1 family aminopeptidase [Deltaproteobacteria bacterium]
MNLGEALNLRMLLGIAGFELRRRRRMLSTYLYFGGSFLCGLALMSSAAGGISGSVLSFGGDRSVANAPQFLHVLTALLSHLGLLITAASFGQAVHQDFETGCHGLFFTTRVSNASYLAGRFLGALLFTSIVLSAIGLGLYAGSVLPGLDPTRLGPNRLIAYVWPYLVSVWPNLFFCGAIFFSLGALLRKMAAVYASAVLLLVGFLLAAGLAEDIEQQTLSALVDPLGLRALDLMTQYWSLAERKVLLIPLQGALLANRSLWLALGAAVLAFTFARFRRDQGELGAALRQAKTEAPGSEGIAALASAIGPVPSLAPPRRPAAAWVLLGGVLVRQSCWSFIETVKNVYFGAILLGCVVLLCFTAGTVDNVYGTATYPVTREMVELLGGAARLFVLIVCILYSGELVHREREARMDQVCDALPLPVWLPFFSKLVSLLLIQVLLLLAVMLTGIAIQTVQGYHHYELGLYVQHLFGLKLVDACLMAVLCLTLHSLVQNKYVGHFAAVAVYVVRQIASGTYQHNLYLYGGTPPYFYSDMNGYGRQLVGVHWFHAYWAAGALLLVILSYLLWQRGLEAGYRARWRAARARFTLPWRVATLLGALAMAGMGAHIYQNTNLLQEYQPPYEVRRAQRKYELAYKHTSGEPQPRVKAIRVALDFFPDQPRLRVRGTYELRNETRAEIERVYVGLPLGTFDRLRVGSLQEPSRRDDTLGFYTFDLEYPLAPGASTELEFDLNFATKGFSNFDAPTNVVENGSYFSSNELPHVGYDERIELSSDSTRVRYRLPPKHLADVSDLLARRNNYLTSDADWIRFEATLSTSPDQIAIAPGELQREWLEDGRRYFQYRAPTPVLSYYTVLSARYRVRRESHHGVALEIYYHPGHEYNLDRMLQGMKDALEYCTSEFGPYPYRELRIAEFPRYRIMAQSFPATIPFSESAGFVADVDDADPDDIDYPYGITAHEVAHQWWAHQVIGGNVQGATFLSESMAEYTALMVMKKRFGPAKMKRFLKYELQQYLKGRGREQELEQPLSRVGNQPYIHYAKGSLAMFALQDYIGEAAVNRAAHDYLAAVKYQPPPYTNSLELIGYIRQQTPTEFQYLIEDLFESITLYDNRALSATYRQLPGGNYALHLRVQASKLRADGLGNASEVAMNDLVDIGVVDAKGAAVHLERRRIGSQQTEIELVLSERPVRAGIDPLNKLIDRDPDDNLVPVTGGVIDGRH